MLGWSSSGDAATEWRQFRVLWRDALRKLLNAAVLGRDIDPVQFSIWATAIVMTPPTLYSFGQMFKYAALRLAPPGVIERVVLTDRMFFVFYSMVAASLLAALTWEALFPDRTDQEVVGVLPVRARTLAGARLAAALCMATLFSTAVNLPSAVFFSLVSVTHPLMGFLPIVLAGQLMATMGGCLMVFVSLLIVRGAVAVVAGADVADRLATVVQFLAIVCLIEVFFYTPTVIPLLVRRMLAGDTQWLAPAWFTALYSVVVGSSRTVLVDQALTGVKLLAGAFVIVVPLYLVPARIMARRALESQAQLRPGVVAGMLRAAARLAPDAASRAVAEFAITSLSRNRRHLLLVVSYAGVGAAIAAIGVIAARLRVGLVAPQPTAAFLAVPLVAMFFVALGLRAAFRIPTDLDANWAFRVIPPSTDQAGSGTRMVMLALVVAPVTGLSALSAALAEWPIRSIILVAAFDVAMGLALVESVLLGWAIVPFACAHEPDQAAIRSRWLLYLIPLNVFAFRAAAFQADALTSIGGSVVFLAVVVTIAAAVRRFRRARARREPLLFEAPADERFDVLNLSEALR